MIPRDFFHPLTFTIMVSSLQGGLHSTCGTRLCPDASQGPRRAGIGRWRRCSDCAHCPWGICIPLRAARIIVAVPVGAVSTCRKIEKEADELVCLYTPEPFYGVGQWYSDFPDLG